MHRSIGKVLVLGSDTRSFLTVIRSLGRKQIEVHTAWCSSASAARHSRYVRKVHEIPKYQPHDNRWKSVLEDILRQEQVDLVIPCDDPSIIPLQLNRGSLEKLARCYLLSDNAFEITYDKRKSTGLAKSLGIPVPHEILLTSSDELDNMSGTFTFPLVLKPISSFTSGNLDCRRNVRMVFDVNELKNSVQEVSAGDPILLQEHFYGVGTGVEIIADQGEILSAFQHLRVHEPLHGGGSSYRKSVELNPELYEAVKRLIKALHYKGVAMIEFKINPRTGKWIFLEINARFWGSLPLAVAAGIDFPWYLYQLFVYGKRDFGTTYQEDLYCRNLVLDLEWIRANLSVDRSNPALQTVPLRKVFAEVLNIVSFKERSDTFVIDDPLPGIFDLYFWSKQKYEGAKKKLGLKLRSMKISRWLTRQKVVKAISNRRKILFVCTGNICRSPFAEQYAHEIFKNLVSVSSSGFSIVPGRKCPVTALEVARDFGINLSNHVTKPLSNSLLEDAGIVFVFDVSGYNQLMNDYPRMKSRLCYLGAFLENGTVVIDDPIGRGTEGFRKAYQDIADAVLRLSAYLGRRCIPQNVRRV